MPAASRASIPRRLRFEPDVSPLNKPDASVGLVVAEAARESSTDSFHLAMAISAGLLLAGALVNAAGIRDPKRVGAVGAPEAVDMTTVPAE